MFSRYSCVNLFTSTDARAYKRVIYKCKQKAKKRRRKTQNTFKVLTSRAFLRLSLRHPVDDLFSFGAKNFEQPFTRACYTLNARRTREFTEIIFIRVRGLVSRVTSSCARHRYK